MTQKIIRGDRERMLVALSYARDEVVKMAVPAPEARESFEHLEQVDELSQAREGLLYLEQVLELSATGCNIPVVKFFEKESVRLMKYLRENNIQFLGVFLEQPLRKVKDDLVTFGYGYPIFLEYLHTGYHRYKATK